MSDAQTTYRIVFRLNGWRDITAADAEEAERIFNRLGYGALVEDVDNLEIVTGPTVVEDEEETETS